MGFFKRLFGKQAKSTPKSPTIFIQLGKEHGMVGDLHFTELGDTILELKRQGQARQAIELLLQCVDATERQAAVDGLGVAPWYYEQLAIEYRKQKAYDKEVAILERYEGQNKAPGVGPSKLAQRLEKARKLLAK